MNFLLVFSGRCQPFQQIGLVPCLSSLQNKVELGIAFAAEKMVVELKVMCMLSLE
jgi:hypothetical protein